MCVPKTQSQKVVHQIAQNQSFKTIKTVILLKSNKSKQFWQKKCKFTRTPLVLRQSQIQILLRKNKIN